MSSASSARLGTEIPRGEPHALSVSLPTWSDNVAYVSGDESVINAMSTGYPRFFFHKKLLQLSEIILQNVKVAGSLSLLFPTNHAARECVAFLICCADAAYATAFAIHAVHIPLDETARMRAGRDTLDAYAVSFPPELKKLGKSFWQHTGMGITSRYAEDCLANIENPGVRYETVPLNSAQTGREINEKLYPEVNSMAQILQKRIASLALSGKSSDPRIESPLSAIGQSVLGAVDVYLYPSGMSAIWHAHQLVMSLKPGLKLVCFGFPYTDTVKVLEKWGPGCIFYGKHPDENLRELEAFLQTTPTPVAALFCESPSNPLLQSCNLPRLRELADTYNFLIVVDDTVGTFVNVNVLEYVDIVATSLSKLFSGGANVLGGSLVFNPSCKFYSKLKRLQSSLYKNDYYLPDLIQMEKNSRDFEHRVHQVDANARAICHFLRSRCLSFPQSSAQKLAIKDVFYPEWVTRENYDLVRRPGREDNFGHLFSLTFVSLEASEAFYDALSCAKGPSLGTNFTLCCPYTLLAHWGEREWAAEFGVEEGIVRVSTGMENVQVLMKWFESAVKAAEATLA
ncbi:hypothetical protein EIP91_010867 [Steccherinum ochraceum]|uniref:Cystathionine gamma-synthase n=1 Tax=Steccherinum ochraceum TaxID=92696 RepID=A0A4R0R294_9APHY|nr:hypothetical protein EIP91_010867 [Steccherinum ochraceum]